jgi:site-specific recombinase XerD
VILSFAGRAYLATSRLSAERANQRRESDQQAQRAAKLTTDPLFQQDAHRIIRRRAKAAGIETRIGNHTFRATGITAYLKNSGKLEVAQQIANHESPRTTKLYDRRNDEISLDEIERITI